MFVLSELADFSRGYKESTFFNFLINSAFKLDKRIAEKIELLIKKKFFNKVDIDTDIFDFLMDEGLIFEISESEAEMFICSKKTYNSPYLIEYLVAHYTGKYSLELLTNLCQDSMIPFLIIKSDMDLVEELSQLISRNSYPSSVSIYTNNQHLIEAGNKFRIYIQKNTFDSFVNRDSLSINKLLFSESKNYNSYFNRKLFIGENGEIKCSPESEENFGQIETMDQLLDIVLIEDFQKYWEVSKDKCDICKDCEYRRMCVDNRIPLKRLDGSYYFEQECNYNPYIAKWKNEHGYVSLCDSGVNVNSEQLTINHDRIAAINKRIWGD
jgi:hypothetical protein